MAPYANTPIMPDRPDISSGVSGASGTSGNSGNSGNSGACGVSGSEHGAGYGEGIPAASGGGGQAPPWPRLRQELSIVPGPVSSHGAPTYTIHDPVGHRFFRLGWQEMEILSRWEMENPQAIVDDIARQTTLSPTVEDVQHVAMFIKNNSLHACQQAGESAGLVAIARKHKVSPFKFVIKNYLFLRLTLLNPDAFLERTLPLVRPFFSRAAFFAIMALTALGLFFIFRNSTFFKHDLRVLFSVQGAFMVLLAMGLSKAVHELGHAYAAKFLGLKVPAMGVALMCFYPILWTDTTEAWKCARRKDRLLIGVAGVGAELALAAIAALAWVLLPSGVWREMALTLAGVTWISTLAVNANPFMRYDAYYVLSDFFEMPMLQTRAFALAKWFMRRKVLGVEHERPESMSREGVFFSIAYAYCIWIYRLFLFLGIAFLVYHMFFKALGILLFAVEIVCFLAWPILKEFKEWWKLRQEARLTPLGCVLLMAVFSLFIPWSSSVVAPAILDAEKTFIYHAPAAARLETDLPLPGTWVNEGELVLSLVSPDLEFGLQKNELQEKLLEAETANAGISRALWYNYATKKEELAGVLAERASMENRRERMTFTAPFSGEVRECGVDIHAGQWIAAKEPLVLIAGGAAIVETLVAEEDIPRVRLGDSGIFIPTTAGHNYFKLRVFSISPGTVTELARPALASVKGGPLPARQGPQGQLWPERAVYRVKCEVQNLARVPAVLTGMANINGKRQSLAGRAFDWLIAGLVRESGI